MENREGARGGVANPVTNWKEGVEPGPCQAWPTSERSGPWGRGRDALPQSDKARGGAFFKVPNEERSRSGPVKRRGWGRGDGESGINTPRRWRRLLFSGSVTVSAVASSPAPFPSRERGLQRGSLKRAPRGPQRGAGVRRRRTCGQWGLVPWLRPPVQNGDGGSDEHPDAAGGGRLPGAAGERCTGTGEVRPEPGPEALRDRPRVRAPSRSGGSWRRGERDRERSQPLQLSPRAVRREAAAASKAMNGGGEGAAAPRGPERRPSPPRRGGMPGAPSARPLVYLIGARPGGPQLGRAPRLPAGGAAPPLPTPHPPAPGVCPAPSPEAGPT